MKRTLLWVAAAGAMFSSFATDSRVISMGKHDAFFMDEVSIFRNPANVNIYPNMVYGSFGLYKPDTSLDKSLINDSIPSSLVRFNRDPANPFFGAIVSYSLNKGTDGGSQFPMVSFGAVFNRYDDLMDYFSKGLTNSFYNDSAVRRLEQPIGKTDLLFGYALPNGGMLGAGTYLAFQNDQSGGTELKSSIYKGSLGVNWPLAKNIDFEASVNLGTITAIGIDTADEKLTLADNDFFIKGDIRLFSALAAINGDFVPHLSMNLVNLGDGTKSSFNLAGGIGLNINIDKGFFWTGIDGLYGYTDTISNNIGAKFSFGIERNIVWDWLVIRVGGQKVIQYVSYGTDEGEWVENNPSTGETDDLVGLGFGVNIENRLRIDFVMAEDVPYTFTNLISGPQHHLFNRVSATYNF